MEHCVFYKIVQNHCQVQGVDTDSVETETDAEESLGHSERVTLEDPTLLCHEDADFSVWAPQP